jgi:hypothetical protein
VIIPSAEDTPLRLIVPLLALLLLPATAHAQMVSQSPVSQGSVTPEAIGKRLEDTAERTRKASPSGGARGAIVDFAWAQDADEYRALGKYVVVLISAVSQDAAELPLKRVYVQSKGREVALQRIGSERREVPKDSAVHAMLGPFREDSFYLAPAGVMMREGTLLVDFAVRRSGFRLYDLPGTPPDFITRDRNPMPVANAKPESAALKTIIEREYSGFALPELAR